MRLGLTSVARMLPDTSIARMMVRCCDGSVITAVRPRHRDQQHADSASSSSSGGTWRRQPGPLPSACLDQRQAGEAHRAASCAGAAATGTAAPAAAAAAAATAVPQARGSSWCDSRAIGGGRAAQVRRQCAPLRLSARAGGAGRRSAAAIRAGRRRWTAPACRRRPAPAPRAASASRCVGQRPRSACESRVVGVDEQLLAGFGVFHRHQAEVGQLHLQRVEQAHRHHLVALRQPRQRVFPAGLADEVGHHEHQRAALDQRVGRRSRSASRSGAARCRRGARPWPRGAALRMRCIRFSTCSRGRRAAAARVSTRVP